MKPQDFLIGLRDFFAVVVPGAIFLFCFPRGYLGGLAPGDPTLALFVAAVAAYVVGSVTSAAGSLLDKAVDPVLKSQFIKRVWTDINGREALARAVKERMLKALPDKERELHCEDVKDFWWAHLRLTCPPAIAELDRLEAAQKLFRSLVPVFAGFALWSWGSPCLAWPGGVGARSFAAAAAVALILYAIGRAGFLSAVYRYAGAAAIAETGKPDPLKA